MLDHFLGNFEVCNHTVCHGPDRPNIARCLTKHDFGFFANGKNLSAASHFSHGHNRWLVENDPLALDVHKSVGGPKIDTDIGRENIKHRSEHVYPQAGSLKTLNKWNDDGKSASRHRTSFL